MHHNSLKTHCPKWHEYTPENTRTVGGKRYCRQCQRDYNSKRWQQRVAARRAAMAALPKDERTYYERHRETCLAKATAYYHDHRDECLERAKAYQAKQKLIRDAQAYLAQV